MLTKTWNTTTDSTVALLTQYIFDLNGYTARELAEYWRSSYPDNWVHLAVIEALYQGRYKAVSVAQILAFWQRRGQALPHFNYEFERLVCSNIQPRLSGNSDPQPSANPDALALKCAYSSNGTASSGGEESDGSTVKAVAVEVLDNNQIVHATNSLNRETRDEWRQGRQGRNLPATVTSPPLRHSLPPAQPNSVTKQPIRQFHPEKTKSTDFYTKLKAICRQN